MSSKKLPGHSITNGLNILIVALMIIAGSSWYLARVSRAAKDGTHIQGSRLISEGVPAKSISLPVMNGKNTIVLVLWTSCPYCDLNSTFYSKLTNQHLHSGDFEILIVFPDQDSRIGRAKSKGEEWLQDRQIRYDRILYREPVAMGFPATPMIVCIDQKAIVTDIWLGKLESTEEESLTNRLMNRPFDRNTPAQQKLRIRRYSGREYGEEVSSGIWIDTRQRDLIQKDGRKGRLYGIPMDELEVRAPKELDFGSEIIINCTVLGVGECYTSARTLIDLGFLVSIYEK